MTYDYNSKIYLAEAVLNVKDLARQTAFYTQIIGLEILSQTETEVILRAGGKDLVHLIQLIVKKRSSLVMASTIWPFCCRLARNLADVFNTLRN